MRERLAHSFRTSAQRVLAIARYTLSAVVRGKLGLLLAAMAGLLVAAAHWLQGFHFGREEIRFLATSGVGLIGLAGTLLALILPPQLFLSEQAAGTTACLLARGVRRGEYLVGMLTGIGAALALATGFLGTVLGVMLAVRSHQLGAVERAAWPLLAACAVQWMKVSLTAALTLCVATTTRSMLFAIGAGVLAVVIGHLRPFASGSLEWLRVWPNLGMFDGAAVFASDGRSVQPALCGLALNWALFTAWLAALATYVFSFREF